MGVGRTFAKTPSDIEVEIQIERIVCNEKQESDCIISPRVLFKKKQKETHLKILLHDI